MSLSISVAVRLTACTSKSRRSSLASTQGSLDWRV